MSTINASPDTLQQWLQQYHASAGSEPADSLALLQGLQHGPLRQAVAQTQLQALLEELARLSADPRTVCSALLFVACLHGEDFEHWRGRLPDGVEAQLDSLLRLQQVQAEHGVPGAEASAEGLRRLLLALVNDVRVVLIALAWQLVQLRGAKSDPERAAELARETMLIHAPLANRLGVWQLKWELEDLAFRFSEPDAYQRIARQVAERRADREAFIQDFIARLRDLLGEAGLAGEVVGRPKHIYSIYRKMQRKDLAIRELFDLRAVRVLVEDVAACYSVLGLVHTHWQPIPGEFDDYITTPKGNNYQSLHTAVIGPEGKAVEVQIRTWAMNEHAELGVAAHWRYKEGGPNDPAFDRKIVAMRQLLDAGEEPLDDQALLDGFQSVTSEDRVYVLTPRGKVVDLASGATVLDFAYQVHTEVGHRCRGAKVNGRIVPLTHKVANGDRIEILTAKDPRPSRDWLNPKLGFIHGARARAKVRNWFKKEGHDEHVREGAELVAEELRRMGMSESELEGVPEKFQHQRREDLYAAVGNGDLTVAQVVSAAERLHLRPTETTAEDLLTRTPRRAKSTKGAHKDTDGGIRIEGVGKLLTSFAKCCQPVPGDPVVGYITRGRGVTIHRADCANVLRWQQAEPHRLLEVRWGSRDEGRYSVGLQLIAFNRRELFKDISSVMASAEVPVTNISSHLDREQEQMNIRLQVEVRHYQQLSDLLARLGNIRNVLEVRRLREPAA